MSAPGPIDRPVIRARQRDPQVEAACLEAGLSPLQARIISGRVSGLSVSPDRIVRPRLADLHDPSRLADVRRASERVARAISAGERLGILTDYDVDGITSHAIIWCALTDHFGLARGRVLSFIGHRIKDGYGVSAPLADRILQAPELPGVIITADCGSSDQAQIVRLAAAGIDVVVTDHHGIPAGGVPESALAVVNPTRADCDFPDSTVAGCMVSWMLMCEVRRRLIEMGSLPESAPKLGGLLDFVALGTVADAVSLFGPGNRAVVTRGLREMNRLRRPCWRAMATLLSRQRFSVQDLGFQIGPRINARGRMADPMAALRFLLATADGDAMAHLRVLDADNQDRRAIEREMVALATPVATRQLEEGARIAVVYDPEFHPGVQGIVASRIVDRLGCPAVVLSPAPDQERVTGSARSIPGLDIRRVLKDVAEAEPGLVQKFGGHAGAAGLTLDRERVDELRHLLSERVARELTAEDLGPVLLSDGGLSAAELVSDTVTEIESLAPFGREFDAPMFDGEFVLRDLRRVGSDGTHLSMQLTADGVPVRAIWFRAMAGHDSPLPLQAGKSVHLAYRLERDDYRGGGAVQLHVAAAE